MRIPVSLALLLCRAVRRSLAIGSRSVGSRTVGVMVIGLLNDHRRRWRRSLLATTKGKHCDGRK
jgi:hypothetical protein